MGIVLYSKSRRIYNDEYIDNTFPLTSESLIGEENPAYNRANRYKNIGSIVGFIGGVAAIIGAKGIISKLVHNNRQMKTIGTAQNLKIQVKSDPLNSYSLGEISITYTF